MRIVAYVLLSLFMISPVWASDNSHDPVLNKVTMKLSADQWVATKSALVTVGVNASVNANGLEKIQDEVLRQLGGISTQGDWHIISFDRSLDQSGLEKVQISAQARLPSAALSNLRDKAKAISKPGETFTLDNVEFTPSEDELREANTVLRSNIYAQAKEELDRLTKLYPEQRYFVHDIDFVNDVVRVPMPMMQNAMAMKMAVPASSNGGNGLTVGDKLVLTATVVLAGVPDHGLLKNIT